MNYIPLYRKYRPQKLEEIVGQEHIKKALKNAIELNKISHAYLFTGPRGTGKTSTARIFAKSLNCKEGPTITPCGKCSNCVDITNSTPMDVIEIDAASNRKVEDAQNILERVMYAPVNSRYKIYIIDEVHMLSTTAFNALLKTLEEPPENVIFILATTEVHKVLDTIKSRCQRFDFKRITTQDIVKHLKYISKQEKINISDDALVSIAKNSAGGMRDSIALLDQLSVLGGDGEISTDDINKLLGRLSFDTLSVLADSIVSSKPESAIKFLEDIYNSGNEPVQILTNLMDYFKNLLIIKTCNKDIALELTQANDAQVSVYEKQVIEIETHQIIFLIDKCSEYIKELKLTNNPRLWLEVAIIDLANLAENTKLVELQNRISRLEGGNVEPIKIAAYKTAPSPVTKPEILKEHSKPEIITNNEKKESKGSLDNEKAEENKQPEPVKEVQLNDNGTADKDDFAPMPKSKSNEGDIAILWGQLLTLVLEPTKSLLRQWAIPVKISPEETVIAMKSEIFLNKIQSASKKVISAVDSLFEQSNSNVIIRLSEKGDEEIIQPKPVNIVKPQPRPKQTEPAEDVDEEEIQELKEISKQEFAETVQKDAETLASNLHSDNVNMVMELFEGKVIE